MTQTEARRHEFRESPCGNGDGNPDRVRRGLGCIRKHFESKEDRCTSEANIWRLGNGAKWRFIRVEFGKWRHVYASQLSGTYNERFCAESLE